MKSFDPEKHRLKRYGLSLAHYLHLLTQQEERCAICGRHRSEFNKDLCIDHDHRTGEVRGLLCDACNKGIGFLQDNPGVVQAAADYLYEKRQLKIAV
jgi:hypothetical protein